MPSAMKKHSSNKENMETNLKRLSVKETDSAEVDTDPLSLVLASIDKKIRNLEKRKGKLEQYDNDLRRGKALTDEQKEAVAKLGEVVGQLDLTKEIQKNVMDIVKQHNRNQKAAEKARIKEKQQKDMAQMTDLLRALEVLNEMGNKETRVHFEQGTNQAIQLSKGELDLLDALYEAMAPTQEGVRSAEEWESRLESGAAHTLGLINKSTKQFANLITYKEASALLDRIINCGYFQKFVDSRASTPHDQAKSDISTVSSAELEQVEQVVAQRGVSHCSSVSGVDNGAGCRDSPSAIVGHAKINFIQDDQTNEHSLVVDTGYSQNAMFTNSMMQQQNMQNPASGIPNYNNGGVCGPPPPIPLPPHQASPSSLDPNASEFVSHKNTTYPPNKPSIVVAGHADTTVTGENVGPGSSDGRHVWHGRGRSGGNRPYGNRGSRGSYEGGRGGGYRGGGQSRGRGPYRGRGGGGGPRGYGRGGSQASE